MLLLRRFNHGGKALDSQIRKDIARHFQYFWENNRTATLLEKKDYFDALPRKIKRDLMEKYLFKDVFREIRFKDFIDNGEVMDPDFLYDLSFGFQPRQFWKTDEDCFIYESHEYISEMYFIMSGKWAFAKKITNYQELIDQDPTLKDNDEKVI